MENKAYSAKVLVNPVASTETQTHVFVRAGTLEELKSKGRLLVHGPHRPILVVEEQDRVYALDNRCPHMGFPLDRGSVEDGILTCHWHHARFDLASGCTFDLWADDVPTCPARGGGDYAEPQYGRPVLSWFNSGLNGQGRPLAGLGRSPAPAHKAGGLKLRVFK